MEASSNGSVRVAGAILLSLAGVAVSGVMLQHHVVVEVGGNPLLNNVCEMAESSSCDEVLASKWGKVFGVPTAMWGIVFFGAMTSWYIAVGRPTGSRRWLYVLPLLGATAGAIGSGFFDYIMFATLDSWCPLCFASHVASWLLLVVTLTLWPSRATQAESAEQAARPAHPSFRLIALAVLLAAAASGAGWGLYRSAVAERYAGEYLERWQEYETDYAAAYNLFMRQEPVDIPVAIDDPVRGSFDAPHTVILFTDFQCPWCKQLAATLEDRFEEFPGEFRVVFKYFPMNTTCNDHVNHTLHAGSCAAAISAEAARLIGGNEMFWKMHDELFSDPKGFASGSQAFIERACQKIGLDHGTLWQQIRTRSAWDRIREHSQQGAAIGMKATPTMYFDGRKMNKWGDKHTWRYMLRAETEPRTSETASTTTQPASQPATQP